MGDLARKVARVCAAAHTSTRVFRAAAVGMLTAVVAYELVINLQLGGPSFATAVDDIGQALAALLAGIACGVAACRTGHSTRLGWALLAAAAFSWATGEIFWSYLEVGLGQVVPSPSPADIGFELMVPFAFAGVFVFVVAASRRAEGIRAFVDGLLIASSLLLVSWETILRSTFAMSSQSALGELVNLSYPVSDVAMITVVVVALTRVSRNGRLAVALLGTGFICIAVSDSAFAYLSAVTNYRSNALDGGWLAGYLLLALASLRARQIGAGENEKLSQGVRSIAPYVAIVLAVGTVAVVLVSEGSLDAVAVRIGAAIAGFSIVSQLLVNLDNRILLRQSRANERDLLESRRSLEQVIDNAPVILFSINTEGMLTLATGKALLTFGERGASLTGHNIREILHASPGFLAIVEEALLGRPGQVIAAFEHGDLDIRLLPVVEDGQVTFVSGVAVDVTERRQALQVRRESEAKSRFLATMSHELRTPLNSVLGFAELLLGERRGKLNEAQQRYVGNIVDGGRHLLSLINDVLDLSRVASGELEVVVRRVVVEEEIAAAVAKMRPLADRKRLDLSVSGSGPTEARADPLRLQQIVLNLLSNAIKFTPEGGRVEVRTSRAGGLVEVEVSDTGIGIAAEHLDRIFDEYSQVDDTYNREQEGTGLGLAVSRHLADLMSATLSVESGVGKGSRFILRLPAISVVPTEDPAGGEQRQGRPDGEAEEVAAEAAQA
jgi:signal transduction histidine kinase